MTTYPTIHLNGTSETDLAEGYIAAWNAVGAAIDAILKIEFNARDYYPQGAYAFEAARTERNAQIAKLQEVREHLGDIAESIVSRNQP